MIKAVFVDRDGTINVEKGHVFRCEDLEFLPGAVEGLRLLTERGISIFIITNQAGIAKGLYTEEDFRVFTEHMDGLLRREGVAIENTLFCPHHPEGIVPEYTKTCGCRKPNTLLLESVMRERNYSIEELILIGDKNSDIDAGNKLGLRTYLVLTGYGNEHRESTKASFVVPDLLVAVKHLLKEWDRDRG
ncbi:MAG: HAD family hydrolase [Syntrophorhabdus sp.]|nr:HAD family hydrolase [Syntrophorhabdus sp.]